MIDYAPVETASSNVPVDGPGSVEYASAGSDLAVAALELDGSPGWGRGRNHGDADFAGVGCRFV